MKKSKKKVDSVDGKEKEKEDKIKSLEEMIANAQQTIADAQQMLTQLKGDNQNSATVFSAPKQPMSSADGQIIHGTFDGQIMVGEDDKQYPVPANYASKSKLVEGDMLKLTITPEGNFVYKQIGPAQRRYLIGIVQRDEKGNYSIIAEGKKYKVLLAAATYFKIEPGDEVTLVVPKDGQSQWAAIENVLKKASDSTSSIKTKVSQDNNLEEPNDFNANEDANTDNYGYQKPSAIEKLEREMEMERRSKFDPEAIADEWTPDIEALKKEARQRVGAENQEE